MAMCQKCAGCNELTSFICAAQFYNGPSELLILCKECWDKGLRCYVCKMGVILSTRLIIVDINNITDEMNDLIKSGSLKEAKLYWDEAGYVTGGKIDIHYPNKYQ